VVLYVDPPYLGSTRSGTNYVADMPSAAEHLELLEVLLRVRATVLLSGYDSPLYAEHLGGWAQREFHATTNGSTSGGRAARTEVVWCNRPLDNSDLGLWNVP
jgi:DNA adenine methylase